MLVSRLDEVHAVYLGELSSSPPRGLDRSKVQSRFRIEDMETGRMKIRDTHLKTSPIEQSKNSQRNQGGKGADSRINGSSMY
jgi:hypothetical protein